MAGAGVEPLLKVSNLSINYRTKAGAIQAVRDVSFDLYPGQSMGLLGESGCGKTTMGQALLKILPDNGEIVGGEILYKGQDLVPLTENAVRSVRWAGISMIFQAAQNAFSPVHRVGEQVLEAIQTHNSVSHNEGMERVAELYTLVGLPVEVIERYPHEYSGGMRQRAMIAMALSCDPDVIIADEPTTALDVLVQFNILKEVRKIQSHRKMAILYISHDVGVVAEMSDVVGVMYAGKMVEFGSAERVFKNTLHPYTQALMNSLLEISGEKRELIPLEGEPPSLIDAPKDCSFRPRCAYAFDKCGEDPPPASDGDAEHVALCWKPGVAGKGKR